MKSHHVQRNQHHCSTFSLGKINWKVHPNIVMSVMARHFCHLCKVMFLNGAMWNIRLFSEPVGATIKKSWPLTNPSTTVLWLSVISLKPIPIFTGVNRFVYVHFLCFLYCLHFKAKCLPRKGLAWIKFFENWRHKKKHFLIGYLGHHTAGQKTGRSNIVCCRREKSISRLTT